MQPYLLRLWHGLYRDGECKRCYARIVWAVTDAGKNIPLNANYVVEETHRDPSRGTKFDLVHRSHVHFGSCRGPRPKVTRALKRFAHPPRKLLLLAERPTEADE